MPVSSSARIKANNPARLILRLCKHWGHKFPVSFDERQGDVQLSIGRCLMQAQVGELEVRLESGDAEQLQKLEEVVADHLQRMAGAEALNIEWRR
ncbi:MAG TPA: DUF2218 domain-containing protein [Burkholderiaceae bacterium]|nr:DUF2218 domain-containing protein [Burkholderiaceae bacterium]